jgi:hypothetical protein
MSDQITETAAFGTGTSTIPAAGDHVATMIFLHVSRYHLSRIQLMYKGFGEIAGSSFYRKEAM